MRQTLKHLAIVVLLFCLMNAGVSGWRRRRRRRGYTPPPPAPPPHCPGCTHGHCRNRPGTCYCHSGWYGRACTYPYCSSCNHGSCTSPNYCRCSGGWYGYDCSSPICSRGCSRGTCTSPNNCHCNRGWTGVTCNIPVCDGECLNGGTCIYPDTCSCRPQYTGPNCKIRLCNEVEAPLNGSVECKVDLTNKRHICNVTCRDGYKFPTEQQPSSLQVCEEDGMFTHEADNIEIPDCTKEVPVDLAMNLTMFFKFPLECEEFTQPDWKEIGGTGLEYIAYRLCNSTSQCEHLVLSVVDYKCGLEAIDQDLPRTKRQTDYNYYDDNAYNYDYHYQEQPTAKTSQMAISLTVEVLTNTNVSGISLGTLDLDEFERRLERAYNSTAENIKKAPIVLPLTRLELFADFIPKSLRSSEVEMKCSKEGEMLIGSSCLNCSRGTFYNNVSHVCEPCPIATYQENEGQSQCIKCPEGLMTKLTGTKTIEGCKSLCPPGFYSSNGYQPCTPCPSHRTQFRVGQTECI